MLNDVLVIFARNEHVDNPEFSGAEQVFTIPYMEILKAQEFCIFEDLPFCYLCYTNGAFRKITNEDLLETEFYIKITKNGFEVDPEEFLYKIVEHY